MKWLRDLFRPAPAVPPEQREELRALQRRVEQQRQTIGRQSTEASRLGAFFDLQNTQNHLADRFRAAVLKGTRDA